MLDCLLPVSCLAIEEVVDLARQINSEVDSDDVQELLDSHYQELTMDKLIEMHEQDIEEFKLLDPIESEDRMKVGNWTEGTSLIEKRVIQILENINYEKRAYFFQQNKEQKPLPACYKEILGKKKNL
ncbi:hypothetical protein TNCV_1588451 [Trichonephila clavipes]|uniref:Uncharacterized protein n=1 Tax=Trichonephila clavipes TaxID=2585209 RepID=A0A8X6RER4_TRICX|nr:hypothetical protein TNCV_1588451 [Trichonephila clavipes]